MAKGLFITFEGGEGTGKTTQINKLASWLKRRGKKVVITREPGGTGIADQIRKILLDTKNRGMHPILELLLYGAARSDHVRKVIQPSLDKGAIVLCDRFTDATLAYQGYGRRLPLPLIHSWNQIATGGLEPTLTFLLDLPPAVGIRRARSRGGRDRFHEETQRFHQRVRCGYLTLARKARKRIRLIDGGLSPNQVFERICREVIQFL